MQLNSLKTKFLAGFLPLFVGSFAVFFAISYYMSSSALFRDADELSMQIGQTAAADIEKEFQKSEMYIEELSYNQAIIGGDHAQRLAALRQLQERSNHAFAMVAYMDLDGQAYNEKDKAMDRASREYFKSVKATGKPFMTGPSVSGSNGKLITIICYPVKDASGKLVGMVYGTKELDAISDIVGQIKYMETGRVFIADQSGITIAYAQLPDTVGKMDLTKTQQENTVIDQALVDGFGRALQEDRQVQSDYKTSQGVDSVAVMTPIHLANRTWVAVSVAPKAEVRADANRLVKVMTIVGLIMIIGIAVAIWIIAKIMCDPVVSLRDECNLLAQGDLRHRDTVIERNDELGDLSRGFAAMRGTIRNLIKDIAQHSQKLSASAEELTAAAHQTAEASNQTAQTMVEMSEGINNQSTVADQVDTTAQDMAAATQGAADNANALVAVTNMTVESVQTGRNSIRDVVDAMDKISASTETVKAVVDKLDKNSEKIGEIVNMISGIAEQTNLLALNAAIEAARAGEAGRGFAVVADEVRKLAEESANSTHQIAELVTTIQTDMRDAVTASEASVSSVQDSRDSVKQADGIFESIRVAVEALAGGIREVSDLMTKIAANSQNMQKAMSSIREISDQNAKHAQTVSATTEEQSASGEEVAASTRTLAEQASDLAGEVKKFKV
jgi:methyl-accepting chemotaxis protein